MLVAKTSFSWGGKVYQEGESVDPKDPVLTNREHLFETVEDRHNRVRGRGVERATAAPGEKRNVTVPKKAAAKKPAKKG